MEDRSPRILAIEWGRIDVEGVGEVKDAKLFPGGGRAWDWTETGTRHRPGIQVLDAEELLAAGATTVVLSRGMDLVLQVPSTTVSELEARGVTVHVLETREAVALYNELATTTPVGGLFHSTC
ncbi:MTH938/NDUFAF3 family protein [Actinopolymorpha sp. B17G11]|uniref:Mth938-like domain-containing protein n=1 Tax=Actinopolymorpha sp. B17G11 TaxID=3160861 RepID=UPI0032E4A514